MAISVKTTSFWSPEGGSRDQQDRPQSAAPLHVRHQTLTLGLPPSLRRSLACTNIIENMMGTTRRVCRNVKRWRDASMALRWTAATMQEAAKGFRRLKARRQLPLLRAALAAHQAKHAHETVLEPNPIAA
jgi:putative transposase